MAITKKRWFISPLLMVFDTKIIKALFIIISVEAFTATFLISVYTGDTLKLLLSFLILAAGPLFPIVAKLSHTVITRRVRMDVDSVADVLTAELKAEKKSLYTWGARSYVLKTEGVSIWIFKDTNEDYTVIRLNGIGDKNPEFIVNIMNKIDNVLR